MRAELIGTLDHDFDPGFLATLAAVQTGISALDATPSDDAPQAERAAVADDGKKIILTLYVGRDPVAAIELKPAAAAAIAGKLLDAASRRITQ